MSMGRILAHKRLLAQAEKDARCGEGDILRCADGPVRGVRTPGVTGWNFVMSRAPVFSVNPGILVRDIPRVSKSLFGVSKDRAHPRFIG